VVSRLDDVLSSGCMYHIEDTSIHMDCVFAQVSLPGCVDDIAAYAYGGNFGNDCLVDCLGKDCIQIRLEIPNF
jgi:hypothetical protein